MDMDKKKMKVIQLHLRLDQEQGYNINVIQQGFEIIDYDLGEGDNGNIHYSKSVV